MEAGDTTSTVRYMCRFNGSGPTFTSSDQRGRIMTERAMTAYKFGAKFASSPAVATKFELVVNGVATGVSVTLSNTIPSIVSCSIPLVLDDSVEVALSYTTGTPSATSTSPQAMLAME
jgi:hypothetical protein